MFLQFIEQDIKRSYQGLEEKFYIHAQPNKAKKLANILEKLEADPMLKDSTDMSKQENQQHDIRVRILSLLLNLSNADTSGKDIDAENVSATLNQVDIENEILVNQQIEIQKWRSILNEGEGYSDHNQEDSDNSLSDWTSSDDYDDNSKSNQLKCKEDAFNINQDKIVNLVSTESVSVPVILPGCTEPLKPPEKIPPPGHSVHADSKLSSKWLSENVLPRYWIQEKDGKTNSNYPLSIPASVSAQDLFANGGIIARSTANMVNELDFYYSNVMGIPVEEKTVVTEYQIMRELIWTFRYPLFSDNYSSVNFQGKSATNEISYPLFSFDSNKYAFVANPSWICMASISPESLLTSLNPFGQALTSLHRLASFVKNVLDRPFLDASLKTSKQEIPPLTFEAYADGLSNILNLFSADLMDIEREIRDRKVAFTLLDLHLKLSSWFNILNCLAQFHVKAVDRLSKEENRGGCRTSNWKVAIVLLASLNTAIGSENKENMHSIFVDLFLKSLAPYFRIIGLWVSQGRLEDWRDEFVFAVDSEYHISQMRLQKQDVPEDCDEAFESESDVHSGGLQETFWTRGFLSRPYKTFLVEQNLVIPEIFDWTFPRILTCGKSIEVLTILEKQGRLEDSSTLRFKHHVSSTQLYEEFLFNLKKSLEAHKIDNNSKNCPLEYLSKKGLRQPKLKVCEIIEEDIADFDLYLIAAFDTLFSKIEDDSEFSNLNPNKKDLMKLQNGFLLSNYCLDPMKPITAKFETCLIPVIIKHVDKASLGLLNLFRNTLNLEEHLSMVRKVYLMEAGDLLSEFYTNIFESSIQQYVQKNEQQTKTNCYEVMIDSLSLTTMLHDCLYRRPPTSEELIENFSVSIDSDKAFFGSQQDGIYDLEGNIHLAYHVDWPVNIVLNSTNLAMYSKVFQFLLKVKHSLWALQEINAKDLAVALAKAQALRKTAITQHAYLDHSDKDDSFDARVLVNSPKVNISSMEETMINIGEEASREKRKIHRILVLRSWLLHFVGNVHSYLMTRVLHTTQLELQEILHNEGEHKINDLDDIIVAHNLYIEKIHDRCFLHQSANVLRGAVIKVLNTCLELHRHCRQFVNDYLEQPFGLSEEECDPLDLDKQGKSLNAKQYQLLESYKNMGSYLLISEKLLNNFEENYLRSHQFLAKTLRSLSQKRNVPHLDGLAAALIYTTPNRTHS